MPSTRPTRSTTSGRTYLDLSLVAQPKWAAWRRRQRLEHRLPENFSDVLTAVSVFADPAITNPIGSKSWRPETLVWDDRR